MAAKGSLLSYQQKVSSDYITNIYAEQFPKILVYNLMTNFYNVCSKDQMLQIEKINVNMDQVQVIEEKTKSQSKSGLWYKIRSCRLTASHVGEIAKRQLKIYAAVETANDEIIVKQTKLTYSLLSRLKSTKSFQSATMREGLMKEPLAAKKYSSIRNDITNIAPVSVVISPWCPWIAASPDRKIYDPTRTPKFGLLEIKCPKAPSASELNYLSKDATGTVKLETNHIYFYQVQTQMAVCGLLWCDFFVMTESDFHLETISFDQTFWESCKDLVDRFYFKNFLMP